MMAIGGSPFLGLSNSERDAQNPLEELLKARKRRLFVLEKQEREYGDSLPSYIKREIEDLKSEIASLDEKLSNQ